MAVLTTLGDHVPEIAFELVTGKVGPTPFSHTVAGRLKAGAIGALIVTLTEVILAQLATSGVKI